MTSDTPETDHITARILAACLEWHDIDTVVISPGSRNAPLIQAFRKMKRYTILDERSAAFFALGVSLRAQKPTVLLCTSGTACLNYAPAVAEAFYAEIPLLIITADRSPEWIDQMDGQTIRQDGIFEPHTRFSCVLPVTADTPEDFEQSQRMAQTACHFLTAPGTAGPAHINVPLREPLYGLSSEQTKVRFIRKALTATTLAEPDILRYAKQLRAERKILVVLGAMNPNAQESETLNVYLDTLYQGGCALLGDHLCNLDHPAILRSLDALALLAEQDPQKFQPDLLIYAGGALVSKPLKRFLRRYSASAHWRIHPDKAPVDLFRQLTECIPLPLLSFLECLDLGFNEKSKEYRDHWYRLDRQYRDYEHRTARKRPYGDMTALAHLAESIPENTHVCVANSGSIRYIQYFSKPKGSRYYSNRGVSGIDGCSSVAVGYAHSREALTLLISGELAFFYDSNAFNHEYVSPRLRVVVINNRGGGIFRLLSESEGFPARDKWIETNHDRDATHIAAEAGMEYSGIVSLAELKSFSFQEFFQGNHPKLLEIFTPKPANASVFRAYLDDLSDLSQNIDR